MNAKRREELRRAIDMLEQAKEIIDACNNEEQEAFDNMPENMQDGERGERLQDNIGSMENAIDQIDEAIGSIEETIE